MSPKNPMAPAIPTGKPATSYGQQVVNAVKREHVKAAANNTGGTPVPARFASALRGATPTKRPKKKGK